ncbi:MAG: PqqD family protein [Candidatus Krumholzibacteriota bacterium]|nr:PqqD family protein [Candidatus Krumholzibacteriota bacterium]
MFRISDKVVFRKVEDKIVLINLETGYYYSLNEIGGFIFNSIRDGSDPSDILRDIKTDFDVSESKAEDDFNNFIEELKREAILYSA